MGRRDELLPIPNRWHDPQPIDPTTLSCDAIDAMARLRALAEAIPPWLAVAFSTGASRKDWHDVSDQLTQAAKMCTAVAGPDLPAIEPGDSRR
jgi:hypothetical protein